MNNLNTRHYKERSNLVAMLDANALALMQVDEIASFLAMTNKVVMPYTA